MRPQPVDESAVKKSEIVEVPLKDPEEKSLVKQAVDTVTFGALNKEEDSK